ncbi:molecular chaperone HtpG [Treponema brennaborense]|uniref:Chaperone protein HtpG n=1 Tax=Treponema brennaborense (strain DSM 12168 / CIP 105900 / DD5/3) TaxID=906968 RepID=F4LMU7_TREBD|nr:molecular chaperone HtpG [Treponema brennaborense]AEE17837.1 Chaperone protein htpG [Treponema brennaborense DSM 12168]
MATYQFQTEVNQLLTLIIHSLYSNKDIFLREIVSNASDALDKLKYLTLSDDAYKSVAFDPRIDISFDEEKKLLVVKDTGIGMDGDDLTSNLGTIARSGTKAFIEKLTADAKKDSSLIGQFGVGFYSAFMAASHIDVYTRKAGTTAIFHWSSDGSNSYDMEEIAADSAEAKLYGFSDAAAHGSAIAMTLNDESKEYASRWKVEELIKRYSDHIAFPIYLHYTQNKYDDKGKVTGSEQKTDKINSASALWKKPKSELKAEDYNAFYKTISHDSSDPLMYVHTHAEGTQEYTTLFYVPETAPFDMYQADYKSGVKLYVKRVFITDDDRELLPAYLRFVRGIIDSEDLPLNVSREILQQNRILETIKTQSVKKLLGEFKKMGEAAGKAAAAAKEAGGKDKLGEDDKAALEKWAKFVSQFNRPLKEGLYSDFANREDLAEIVRFKSTAEEGTGDDNWTSFADYVQRMSADQKAIYYITGSDEKNLRASPLLEAYKAKGLEVLIMADDIDDIVIPSFGKYKDFELKAVNRAGSDEELGVDKKEAEKKEKEFKPVVEKIKKALGDKVKDVHLSKRLSDSPSCIVVDENDPSLQMERMMRAMGQNSFGEVKPILEVNGDHPIVSALRDSEDESYIEDVSTVLLDQALLVSGETLKDPADFVKRLNNLLGK